MAILQEIQRTIPEYARPLEGRFGEAITEGIEQTVKQFIDRVADPNAPQEDAAKVFRELARLEAGEGRGVDTLQSAYHVGARVAWRLIAEFSQAANLPAATICRLADALFTYIDEISALSVEGYAAAKVRAAGALERRRRRLLELILSEPPVSPQALAELAASAQWELSEHVAAVALAQRNDRGESPAFVFDASVLADLDGCEPCLVVAEPHCRRQEFETELRGWRAVVGPRVRLSAASTSLKWARRAMALIDRGVLPDKPVTWCGDNLSTLLLTADDFLVRELAERSLAPMASLTAKQRARLSETLLALLETRGSAPEIANRLHIHPQTVRYRMHQLEALFGDHLRDPDERFALEISLRAQRLQPDAGSAQV